MMPRVSEIQRARASLLGEPPGSPRSATGWMLAVVIIFTIFTSGCRTSLSQWYHQGFKVGPDYVPPAAPASDEWIDSDNPRIELIDDCNARWWASFNDPVLDHLIELASQQNLPLQEAGARIWEARARRAQAHGNLFPQVQEGVASYTRTQWSRTMARPIRFPTFDNWLVGFDASWELDFWGRYRRIVEAADAEIEASVEDWRDTLVMLQAEVAATYVEIRVAQQRIELARQNVELQTQSLSLAEMRFREGRTTKLDELQARENLATIQAAVPEFERLLRESQNALCVLLGMPPYDITAELGSAAIPQPQGGVAVGIPAQLLTRRPDVRQVERRVAAQSARIGVAETDLYPRIALRGTIGYESRNLSTLFNSDSFTGTIGPSLRWNLLNYGRIASNIEAEEAEFWRLVFHYQDVVIRAHQEAEDGINRFLQEQERLQYLEVGEAAAVESTELAQRQYEAGRVDFQRLIESQRALARLQDQVALTQGQAALGLVAVYKALGGGWQGSAIGHPMDDPQPFVPPDPEIPWDWEP